MGISHEEFIPRPGIVNKPGRLPDPCELVCIEVPKIFDQCLIKRCLVYAEGPDTNSSDEELRSNPLNNIRRFIGCRDFNITLLDVDKIPIRDRPGYKRVIINFRISFYADYQDNLGNTQSEFYEINRTEIISRLYCPDSLAQVSASFVPVKHASDLDQCIIKLELVAECLDDLITQDCNNNTVLDITLGFHLVVKCELVVQLLIPTYDYCPIPKPCEDDPIEDPCERFNRLPVPQFYPDNNLEPLFPDDDDDEDNLDSNDF
ncbi:MAG: hypothetical protein Q8936_05420 [Bacillota bacterium]|nr:hypothetical protein [Bacillota bacterium]